MGNNFFIKLIENISQQNSKNMNKNSGSKKDSNTSDIVITVIAGIGILAVGIYQGIKEWKLKNPKIESGIKNENDVDLEKLENISNISEYDYGNINQEYTCPISKKMIHDPYMIIKCGHTFEKAPIVKYIKEEQKCYLCQNECKLKDLIPNYG